MFARVRAEQPADLLGDGGEDVGGVALAGDERRDAPQGGLLGRERAQLLVGAPAVRDVADVAGEQRRAVELGLRDRDLDREQRAVRSLALELDRVVDHPAVAGLEVAPHAAAVQRAQPLGDDQVGESRPTICSAR